MQEKIFHLSSWAQSSRGTPIELYKKTHIRDGKATAPILFIGGVHGDEPEGVRLALDLLEWLQKMESTQPQALMHSWLLVPCLNVDGFLRNQRTNANGVDLNRNFPARDWSAENTRGPRYSPGKQAGSELETQAIVELIHKEQPRLIVHFHSWKPCVVYTGAPGKVAAEIIATRTGYEAREDIGYPTPGSLGQYGWLEHGIPVICIEEQEKIVLDLVWPRFQTGLARLLTENF